MVVIHTERVGQNPNYKHQAGDNKGKIGIFAGTSPCAFITGRSGWRRSPLRLFNSHRQNAGLPGWYNCHLWWWTSLFIFFCSDAWFWTGIVTV